PPPATTSQPPAPAENRLDDPPPPDPDDSADMGGRGGMRGRTAAVPTVALGQPEVQGDLDKAIVHRYVKRNRQKLQYCYEKELMVKPSLAGAVTVEFTIEATGDVSGAKATGIDPNVASCAKDVVASIQFPKPKTGIVKVKVALVYRTYAPYDGST